MTDCISPPPLEDQELLAYLDGEAAGQVAEHLRRCSYCRLRAGELARLQHELTAKLYRLDCPTSQELGDFNLGYLPRQRAATIASHLRICPHCTQELALLKDYLSELAPPEPIGPLGQVKKLVARLVGEGRGGGSFSGALTPAFALRGGLDAPLTLEADGILITLDIQPTNEDRLAVLGQLAAEEQDRWTGASVELRQGSGPASATKVDDLGAFRFDGIQPGPVELEITPLDGPVIQAKIEISA